MTKPTGKPRGRPKTKAEPVSRSERGRPAVPFLQDPDRYLVAIMRACAQNERSGSIRRASEFVAALEIGNELNAPKMTAGDMTIADIIAACPAGMVPLMWGPSAHDEKQRQDPRSFSGAIDRPAKNTIRLNGRVRASTIKLRAEALRKKERAARDEPWLLYMSAAFDAAFNQYPAEAAKLAQMANEAVVSNLMAGIPELRVPI